VSYDFINILFARYFSCDPIKENETGRMCSLRGRDEKCVQNIGWNCLKGRENFEYPGVRMRIVLKPIVGKYGLRVWIGLIQLKIRSVGEFFWNKIISF
jgi:hypothetical protein